jgi:hypothetical protein
MKDYLDGGGEFAMLGPAEQFSWDLAKVPQLRERLQCFKFMNDFDPKKVDLKPDLDTLEKSSTFVREDKKISALLELILHMGNFLNAGNPRLGKARGFGFETIAKLQDTKTADNKGTVVDVLVELVKDQKADLLKFSKEELALLDSGARVSLQTVEAEMKKLSKDFESVTKTAPTIEANGDDDVFQKNFNTFQERAKVELKQMEEDFKKGNDSFLSIVTLFGEDPKIMGPEEFFVVWKNFCAKIVETDSKIDQEREKAEKLKKREKANQKREASFAAPVAGEAGAAGAEGGGAEGGEGGAAEGGAEGAGARGARGARGAARGARGAPRGRGGRGGAAAGGGDPAVVDELFAKMQQGNVFAARRKPGAEQ